MPGLLYLHQLTEIQSSWQQNETQSCIYELFLAQLVLHGYVFVFVFLFFSFLQVGFLSYIVFQQIYR